MYIFIETKIVDKVTIHGGDWGRMEGKLSVLKFNTTEYKEQQFKVGQESLVIRLDLVRPDICPQACIIPAGYTTVTDYFNKKK